jgi:hypothetical protein
LNLLTELGFFFINALLCGFSRLELRHDLLSPDFNRDLGSVLLQLGRLLVDFFELAFKSLLGSGKIVLQLRVLFESIIVLLVLGVALSR